jgi:hypothetical protein
MKRLLFCMPAFLILILMSYGCARHKGDRPYYGRWVVSTLVDNSGVSDGTTNPKDILGKTITYSPNRIATHWGTCRPLYEEETVKSQRQLLEGWGYTYTQLNIEERTLLGVVVEVTSNRTRDGREPWGIFGCAFMVVNKNKLLEFYNGGVYLLTRKSN